MASYNHERFVAEAVESVLRQGVGDLELIVVDDGSPDATADVVEAVRDPRVRLVRLNHNRRYQPRNVALDIAAGRYLAFQNSDDTWREGKLAAQLEHMEGHPECSICFTGVEVINEGGAAFEGGWAGGLFTTENRSRTAWLEQFFDAGNCLCITSALTRRKLVDDVGRFKASLFHLGDLDLWVRLSALGELHILEEALTCFRVVGEENLSTPTAPSARRATVEYADVLARYAEPPVLPLIGEVFPRVIPKAAETARARLAGLAVHAWSKGPAHRLFADRVLKEMLENPEAREELVGAFSEEIVLDFIRKRGELVIGSAE